MRAINKDFFREIKKNKGRFLSMFFIVALGVAFFSGIRSSEPDMRITGDAYFDVHKFMDVQVIGTMGLTNEDVSAIKKVDGVQVAEGSKSIDLLSDIYHNERVLHVMSYSNQMNTIDINQGRLPKTEAECLVDQDFLAANYLQIGDTLTLRTDSEDSVSDSLKQETYTIVGAGSSPQYISFSRGSSSVGDGNVDGFLVVLPEAFSQEFYNSVYLQVKDARKMTAFTEGYSNHIDRTVGKVENIQKERCTIRRTEIVEEAQEEVSKAEEKLAKEEKETKDKLIKANAKLTQGERQLTEAKKRIKEGTSQIQKAWKTLKTNQKKLENGLKEYEDGVKKLEQAKKQFQTKKKDFTKKKKKAQKQLAQGKTKLDAARKQLDQGWANYKAVKGSLPQAQADAMKAQLDAQEKTYSQQKKLLKSKETELKKGEKALISGEKALKKNEDSLKKAKKQLDSGKKKLAEGQKTIVSKEVELEKGKQTIEASEKKLAEGKEEYQSGKKERDEKIAEAKAEIADARKDIEEIETPKWYVQKRDANADYTGYGENADRMRSIGKVFPVIFFLVAALISLTTMTRMVEEERVQIGTLKALGYRKKSIAGKYIKYAMYATIGGSIFGVLIGEKVLPYIIIYAYGIMYKHMPEIYIPYNLSYGLMAAGAAIFCTLVATIAACYKELLAQPAVLMRPPSPKSGRRVLLEHIPILWRHMSFTWKSTVRNLLRYKKRFFMTVLGIGGCMGLMIVGFGLRDSIFEIVEFQYRELQHYDGELYMQENAKPEDVKKIDTYLQNNKNIQGYMEAQYQKETAKHGEKSLELYLCIPSDITEFKDYVVFRDRLTKEGYDLSKEGVILTEKASQLLNVKVGDTISVKDDDGEASVKVAAICENYLGHYLYLSPSAYEKAYQKAPAYHSVLYRMKHASDKELLQTGKDLLEYEGVLNVSYTYDMEDRLNDMLGSLNLVIIVLIVSAGMLAFVVLYNLNNVNINERRREIATIKVLGFYDGEVGAYVYRENVLLTLIGSLAGIVIGNLLHRFTIVTVEIDSCMFGRSIHPISYLWSFLFTIAFAVFVNFVMYFKLKKIDMVESLKSIE